MKTQIVEAVKNRLSDIDKEFLLAFKNAKSHLEKYAYADFPSIKWMVKHLQGLIDKDPNKHQSMYFGRLFK